MQSEHIMVEQFGTKARWGEMVHVYNQMVVMPSDEVAGIVELKVVVFKHG